MPAPPLRSNTMGFFENLGRKVEQFKRASESAATEDATHGCRDCGEPLFADRETCPECGSDDVVELDGA